ncbi:hypothetical protein FB565_007341 [Actinoplanes lutulentus]|uniref:Uncharacterized protein n=1 Tax=Actinoplanes lutulentus TaxID=1287878 RepID=A0A327Z019_9ACTN|nr:hypothetical protein [Actinoplanes lutulentus]RAK27626.1 hypothetical protein B0I29_1229 [Actinoplanes lutulentus]
MGSGPRGHRGAPRRLAGSFTTLPVDGKPAGSGRPAVITSGPAAIVVPEPHPEVNQGPRSRRPQRACRLQVRYAPKLDTHPAKRPPVSISGSIRTSTRHTTGRVLAECPGKANRTRPPARAAAQGEQPPKASRSPDRSSQPHDLSELRLAPARTTPTAPRHTPPQFKRHASPGKPLPRLTSSGQHSQPAERHETGSQCRLRQVTPALSTNQTGRRSPHTPPSEPVRKVQVAPGSTRRARIH